MYKKYTLFIFRRDLRLIDNKGLLHAMHHCKNIVPIFIFTPEQTSKKNNYKSENAIQFMVESLKELDQDLKKYGSKLHIFCGNNIDVLKKIIEKIAVTDVIFNQDYTPYARKRDKQIATFCKKNNITCTMIEDYLLSHMGTITKTNGELYSVFTPFKNKGLKQKIDKPINTTIKDLCKTTKLDECQWIVYTKNPDILVNGGRTNALKQLRKVKQHKNYNENRNDLTIPTTHLSAFLKFGCISIREAFWHIRNEVGINNGIVSQLFWREMYYYVTYHFPDVLKGKNFNAKYDNLSWKTNTKLFNAWCNGTTGFPIVDAGMHELNITGYMHNRARLITANFLNRILACHWRDGEHYYAQQLVDYDPAVNNGNWQWIASVGIDPKPYFQRIFNPWLQSAKFDPEAQYIKTWLPQLKNIPANELHAWDRYHDNYDAKELGYNSPIIAYKKARAQNIVLYRSILKQ